MRGLRSSRKTRPSSSEDLKKLIPKVDKSDLKSDFDSWPELAEEAWSHSSVNELHGEFESVIFSGMGGSGIIGALAIDVANEINSPLFFVNLNDYHLPMNASDHSLVVAVSCSGNTEETLSSVSEAHSRGLTIASFGSGGRLLDFSQKWHFRFTQTKMLKVPRSSLPGLFFPVLKLLSRSSLLPIRDIDVEETIDNLKRARDIAKIEDDDDNPSVTIARQIVEHDCIPLIYSQRRTRAVGLRFRQSLNENAKMHAFNGEVPEICHNDIVGWDNKLSVTSKTKLRDSPFAVILQLEDDPDEIRVRLDILREIVRDRGGTCMNAPGLGKTFLSRILTMLYFLDYSSYYAAILRRVNPIVTPSIDFLKSELTKKLDFLTRLS